MQAGGHGIGCTRPLVGSVPAVVNRLAEPLRKLILLTDLLKQLWTTPEYIQQRLSAEPLAELPERGASLRDGIASLFLK
jgi:hypothetical protein